MTPVRDRVGLVVKKLSSGPSASRPSRAEYAGVVALSMILVVSLAGVWQRSGVEAVAQQVSCQVKAAVPGGDGPCDTARNTPRSGTR